MIAWRGRGITLKTRNVMAHALATVLLLSGCAAHPRPTTSAGAQSRAERDLTRDLSRIFEASAMSQAFWGVEVRSMTSGAILYELNSRKLMMPASNMKIVTLATAAETLGWDYRFTTTLETSAPVEGGTLAGDLIVRGGGDPTINAREGRAAAVFDAWADALKGAGISHIDGRVVGDDNAFDDATLGGGWAWDYLQYGYAAPVGALEYNESIATLAVRPGAREGDPVFVDLSPGAGLRLFNRALTGPRRSPLTIDYERRSDSPTLDVIGGMAVDADPMTREVAVVNPTVFFARAVKDALVARGIEVTGDAIDADDVLDTPAPGDRHVLAKSDSAPLSEIATVLMKVSQNLYAETLLKAVGAVDGGLGTTEGGRVATRKLLDSWGIPQNSYVQMDGSGLSRYDYVTANMLVTILERVFRNPRNRDAFISTLPIAGKDGTIEKRMRMTRAENNVTAKTGSIANVRCLSGFVRTRDDEVLAFSILANNFTAPAATVNWITDLAVEKLAEFSRK
jgi:D-alanyl-D-alanine carboxypeptidase/D-alanyl-D-alanine-endopeptidase (penicillin-binding protein 4)